MRSLAVLSMHTSPLAQPGTGDGGGMTVYRLISAGSLPAVRVGKSYRLTEADVDRYLQQSYTETA